MRIRTCTLIPPPPSRIPPQPIITAPLAAWLASSLLGHVLFLKNQVPLCAPSFFLPFPPLTDREQPRDAARTDLLCSDAKAGLKALGPARPSPNKARPGLAF